MTNGKNYQFQLGVISERRKMRRGSGSKQKGASFEREVCKSLSLWVSGGKQEDVFWRAAMSGGRSTVAHTRGKRLAAQAGDISCIHSIGNVFSEMFLMECKHYANLNYAGLLTSKGHFVEFWNEAKNQAHRYQKQPFLITKQNRQPMTFSLSTEGIMSLGIDTGMALLISPKLDLYIYDAERFLKDVVPPGG